ncbi:MAG: phosphate ABC transporter substrate-binding protein PstS, partial [Acidimicrobiales bacterium]
MGPIVPSRWLALAGLLLLGSGLWPVPAASADVLPGGFSLAGPGAVGLVTGAPAAPDTAIPSSAAPASGPSAASASSPSASRPSGGGKPGPSGRQSFQANNPQVTGSGATFPKLEIDQWRADEQSNDGISINYNGTGSGAGRSDFANSAVDFGVSDIRYQTGESSGGRSFAYIPISAGGVGFMYNLKDASGSRITDLQLSPTTICKIFTGNITNWNDPAITADNGGAALASQKIKAVTRSDASGTSFVLSEYCIAYTPDVWAKFAQDNNIDNAPNENWPSLGAAAQGSDGSANYVAGAQTGPGAICYVEAGYASERSFPVASVLNANQKFTQPTEDGVTAALSFATQRDDGTHELNLKAPGDNVYNPSTYSYLLAPTSADHGFDKDKGRVLGTFLNYALTDGQSKAGALGYAALGQSLQSYGLDQVQKIPGAPPRPQYPPAGGGSPSGGAPSASSPSGGAPSASSSPSG